MEEKPSLTGLEVRFIRKFLELTQVQLAELLGVEDQSVRRWEKLDYAPKPADHGIRLVFRDLTGKSTKPLPELFRQIHTAEVLKPRPVRFRFYPRARKRWQPQERPETP